MILRMLLVLQVMFTPVLAQNENPEKKQEKTVEKNEATKSAAEKPNNKEGEDAKKVTQSDSYKEEQSKPPVKEDYKTLDEITINYEKLKEWNGLRYLFEEKGGPAPEGKILSEYWSFKTTVKNNRIIIEDSRAHFDTDPDDILSKRIFKVVCQKDSLLSPIKASYLKYNVQEKEEIESFKASFENGKIKIKKSDAGKKTESEKNIKKNTLLGMTAFRLIPQIPNKKGDKYKICYYYTMSVSDYKLTYIYCDGEVKDGGETLGRYIVPFKDDEVYFYVDKKGRLVKMENKKKTYRIRLEGYDPDKKVQNQIKKKAKIKRGGS